MRSRGPARGPPAAAGLVLLALLAGAARAVVNPSLQPAHVYDRYLAVLGGQVTKVDEVSRTVTMRVTRVVKGAFTPTEVALVVRGEDMDEALLRVSGGQTLVAFAGRDRRGRETDVLFYPGGGIWQAGRLETPAAPGRWLWTDDLEQEMFGTFNGAPERLLEMLVDHAAGRAFFPAVPFTRFRDGLVLGTSAGPVRGVALYDVDGDGRLDAYACSEAGNRAYLQAGPLEFRDATARLGLEGVASPSCSFADVNADGRPDLLAGGVLYVGGAAGFARSDLLPPDAARDLKTSAFVEINGDGWPDVVVSREGGGLAVYLNPGAGGGPFADATAALGLGGEPCGAGLTGFFAPGDWNDDGRTDLFYAAGRGLLLVQGPDGRFAPRAHGVPLDFTTGGDAAPGLTGAGAFAALWRPDRLSLVVPLESEIKVLAEEGGVVQDVAPWGNEISEAAHRQLAAVAEDLNADGYVDLYTISGSPQHPNTYHTNRGYGSFMRTEKYTRDAFPARAHGRGAGGVAAGDADGDGANDLLLGGADGSLTLMTNAVLAARTPVEHPTAQEQKLLDTRLLAVIVRGRLGVLGAKVTLVDEAGAVVARRDIGANVATGCRGPDAVALAVREPGRYSVVVRYADGTVGRWPVDLGREKRLAVEATRPEPRP